MRVYLQHKGLLWQTYYTEPLNGSTAKKVLDLSNKTTAVKTYSYTFAKSTAQAMAVFRLTKVKK